MPFTSPFYGEVKGSFVLPKSFYLFVLIVVNPLIPTNLPNLGIYEFHSLFLRQFELC